MSDEQNEAAAGETRRPHTSKRSCRGVEACYSTRAKRATAVPPCVIARAK